MMRRSIILGIPVTAAIVAAAILRAGSAFAQSGTAGFVLHEDPQPAPALEFVDDKAQSVTLAAFKGRTVLLNIWATWCIPCRKEMPTLDRLESQLGGPGFAVVALSIDRGGVDAVKAFFDQLGIRHLKIYVDPAGNAAPTLRISGLPTTLLIDPDGREIGRLIGPAEWDSPETLAFLKAQLATSADREGGYEPPAEAD
ncbi:MAG: TlpA family protein disulfide reductase [Dongiaceae bacterium]